MELYTNSTDRTITLEVPVIANSGSMDVTIYDGDDLVHTVATVFYTDGVYSITLPFSLVQNDRNLKVHWKFNYVEDGSTYEFSEYQEVSVVTPILSLAEVKKIIESDDDEEAVTIEKAVRYIIQAHCGQFFGRFVGKRWVTGSGENSIRLPSRLISLTSVNDGLIYNDGLSLRGNGWYLVGKTRGVPSIRADAWGWHETPYNTYTSEVPIYAPSLGARALFLENVEYAIDGVWGWNSVPASVSEAAKLLVNDYACGDNNYRDRFLTSMTAADWRIQFHDGAFSNTGNVRANQLLADYVLRRGWVVV
jgi:hypothetical protein